MTSVQEHVVRLGGVVVNSLDLAQRVLADAPATVPACGEPTDDIVRMIVKLTGPFAQHLEKNDRLVPLDHACGATQHSELGAFDVTFDQIDPLDLLTCNDVVERLELHAEVNHLFSRMKIFRRSCNGAGSFGQEELRRSTGVAQSEIEHGNTICKTIELDIVRKLHPSRWNRLEAIDFGGVAGSPRQLDRVPANVRADVEDNFGVPGEVGQNGQFLRLIVSVEERDVRRRADVFRVPCELCAIGEFEPEFGCVDLDGCDGSVADHRLQLPQFSGP